MMIWTVVAAFSGVYEPLHWFDTSGGSDGERLMVGLLLVLSIAGMMGNVGDPGG